MIEKLESAPKTRTNTTMAELQRIRTNLITGFLGTGKTTTINALIRQRPDAERWAVFVNEFGMVSVDHVLYEGQDPEIEIAELGGGCMCCSTAFLMPPLLARLIRTAKPHRLLIEPTGVGHPAAMIDQLRGEHFGHLLELGPTLCVIDPKDFANPRLQSSPMFFDQIQMADIIVINWTDTRDPALVRGCREWVEQFDPPKLFVQETSQGQIPLHWLDLEGSRVRLPRFQKAHDQERQASDVLHQSGHSASTVLIDAPPILGHPRRFENSDGLQHACGWIFHPDERFDRDALFDFLTRVGPILRLKGVFRCEDDWWAINRVKDETHLRPSTYRRDSRLEVILDEETRDWSEFESELLSSRQVPE
ncbi:CobW family GTP-binding protein [Tautonia rosea]|uniref:CobW family GTP-binding protein n=1 Tax=Tautonia rosea TaxID=2728037 RepID=UPI0019D25DD2|nr:GTP-binding protein [Tautonia rosea]